MGDHKELCIQVEKNKWKFDDRAKVNIGIFHAILQIIMPISNAIFELYNYMMCMIV